MSLHTYLWRPLGSAGSSQVNASSVCLRAAACCSPARGHTWPSFFLPNPPAYNTAPVLIGRPDATLSKATGCAVYQLTSAYRTKEQLSGCWASASSPSCEFSFRGGRERKKTLLRRCRGVRKHKCVTSPQRGQLHCWGSTGRAEPSRAEPRGGPGRSVSRGTFHTELAAEALQLLTAVTQRSIPALLSEAVRGQCRRPSREVLCGD